MVKNKIFVTIIILLASKICFSQLNDKPDGNALFSKGIYLVDKNLVVPWDINLTELSKYGNPRVMQAPRHRSQYLAIWDSVKILNGIRVNLRMQHLKTLFKRNEIIQNNIINAEIDSLAYHQLISFFNNYKNRPKYLNTKEKKNGHFFAVGDCLVYVRFWRRTYHLSINRSRSRSVHKKV